MGSSSVRSAGRQLLSPRAGRSRRRGRFHGSRAGRCRSQLRWRHSVPKVSKHIAGTGGLSESSEHESVWSSMPDDYSEKVVIPRQFQSGSRKKNIPLRGRPPRVAGRRWQGVARGLTRADGSTVEYHRGQLCVGCRGPQYLAWTGPMPDQIHMRLASDAVDSTTPLT